MIKTLRITFSLRFAAKVNAVLYVLKHFPLLGRCFPDDVYRVRWLKGLASVVAFFWELGAAVLGKAVYLVAMVALASLPYPMEGKGLFGHFLVFLTLTGGMLNGYLFDADEAADQAVLLLGMDAKKYTLVNFGYALAKVLLGFYLCGTFFGRLMGAPLWLCLLVPLYVVGVKLTAGALRLRRFEKKGDLDENDTALKLILIFGGLALAYGLPALKIVLPEWVCGGVMGAGILAGVLSVKKILGFDDYRYLRQRIHNDSEATMQELEDSQAEASRNKITDRADIKSNKKSFWYLNDLFIQRHRKIFWKPSLIVAAVASAAVVLALAAVFLFPELREPVNGGILNLLPATAFLMYLINRGTEFTQALFVNCDRSLLTYSFYKQPKHILKLFAIRLLGIIRVNLVPAVVIAAGLPLVLWASGGTALLNYAVVPVTVLALSVFFSVHYLTLYYLLQPYTAGTELKSGLYSAITGGTYVVCYMLLDIEGLSPIGFGIGAIIFSLLYCLVACVLVYFLAPKTFRIRN